MKDKIYSFLVRRNEKVCYEYERYVQEHLIEHYESRLKHWKILGKLNLHYRVKKRQEPMLYWDHAPWIQTEQKNLVKMEEKRECERKAEKVLTNLEHRKSLYEIPGQIECKKTAAYPESNAVTRASVSEMAERLKRFDVVSFDMFDTLIFRALSDPRDLFWLVGNQLCIPNFKILRSECELCVRQKAENGEVTLEEIYEEIARKYGVETQNGMRIELSYEKAFCYANPYLLEVYHELIKLGKRIIVTSNMYLNSNYLKEILKSCGYDEIDEVYVSCELGASKKHGLLQKLVSEKVGREKKIAHIGDNYFMDIEGSRIAGWYAIYYENVNKIGSPYRPEKMAVISGSIYKGLVNAKVFCGIKNNPYYEYGYAYVGYLVYGFCKYLNHLAKVKDIDKFLFVSRDMNVVYEAYQTYLKKIEGEYIKASRTSSIHLSMNGHMEHYIDWHIKRRLKRVMTISQVLEELNLDYLKENLGEYGLQADELFSTETLEGIETLIFDYKDKILQSYEVEKKAAYQYYREKIGNAKNICIVDLGWKNSTGNSLNYFLNHECNMGVSVIAALLGTEGHAFVDSFLSDGSVYSYMFSSMDNTDYMTIHNKNGNIWRRIYEIIFTSNEQSLLNFALDEKEHVSFHYLRKEIRDDDIVTNIQKGILDFVADFSRIEANANTNLELYARDCYKPLQKILFEKQYHYELFKDFEVCFIAGDVKQEEAELFKEVVVSGGK